MEAGGAVFWLLSTAASLVGKKSDDEGFQMGTVAVVSCPGTTVFVYIAHFLTIPGKLACCNLSDATCGNERAGTELVLKLNRLNDSLEEVAIFPSDMYRSRLALSSSRSSFSEQ